MDVQNRPQLVDQVVLLVDLVLQGSKCKLKYLITRSVSFLVHNNFVLSVVVVAMCKLMSPGSIELQVGYFQVGLIIGRGGETIKNLQSRCGVRIQVVCLVCLAMFLRNHFRCKYFSFRQFWAKISIAPVHTHGCEPGLLLIICQVQNDGETEPGATERLVTLIGNKKATDMAYDLIKEVIDEVNLLAAYGQFGERHPCLHAHVCVGVLGCKLCFGCMQIHLWCL